MSIEVIERHESQVRTYCRHFPALFKRAEGSHVFDSQGRRYLDFLAGAGSLNYGHNNPYLREALIGHLNENGICQSLDLYTTAKADFMEAFFDHILAPRNLADYRLQFVGPTGTNAVEAAFKLARKVTGRHQIVAFTRGFHGVSLGALAASAENGKRRAAGQPLNNVLRAPFEGYFGQKVDTIAIIEKFLDDPNSGWEAPAAFVVEVVQGEGGLETASPGWLQRLAALASRLGSLLIIDEIQTGCGRTGDFFAFEASGIKPDLICVSKSISGFGLPMSLLLIRSEHDQWAPGEHNGTFRGSNLSFVTATAAIRHYWLTGDFIGEVRANAVIVRSGLNEIASRHRGVSVVGRGMMLGLRFSTEGRADAVSRACFEQGLIVETCGPHGNTLKLLPPLTTPEALLEEGIEIIARCTALSESRTELLAGAA
ncbi:diaminobutyrate--2-oxoglutarate transaminase [Labrys okinawensis]|uniref:Diaminobutyrate--2-oxoglutarate transaminase n=1 Tax=Labrys okinawensis TaxID=346911 RepID=A0A2S9QIP0_9HYPH|nr:diaminobutyrate--2-oxoglutarate transaminase [Labrys okinawensis]PRH89218.1 diaminobutyrate--2-oxoglutarate transaminase [Labrys okinawensis]